MTLKGIDVSYHQGRIDWKKVKNAGIQFAMLRAGYGKNNLDKQFHNNANGCRTNGIPFGVYWFSYAYTVEMARQEARYCVAAIEQYEVQYPVCYDLEYDSISYAGKHNVTIGKTLATKMAVAFCEEVERLGYKAMNYANLDYAKRMFGSVPYDLWFARYNPTPGRADMAIWQYSSSGSVSGITGKVDMNYCYKDYVGASAPLRAWVEMGDRGQDVKDLQTMLNQIGYNLAVDGIFGAATDEAVRQFQTSVGIAVDGQAGKATIVKIRETINVMQPQHDSWVWSLQDELNRAYNAGLAEDGIPGPETLAACPLLMEGAKGNLVKLIQQRVGTSDDGIWGYKTTTAVKAYQTTHGLDADGIIGHKTWRMLLGL